MMCVGIVYELIAVWMLLICVSHGWWCCVVVLYMLVFFFFFQAEDGIRDSSVTGVQTCALPISLSAWLRIWRGEPELALEHVANAIRMSPLDPGLSIMHGATAFAHFLASRYDMASSSAEKSMRDNPTNLLVICISAVSNALAVRLEPAQKA